MNRKILPRGRINAIPAMLILILLILVQSQGAHGMVVLTDEEATSVTGSGCSKTWCVLDGNGCWAQITNCPTGEAADYRDCKTPCSNPAQNMSCKWNYYFDKHDGCVTDPATNCGTRDEGYCDGVVTGCTVDTWNVSCGTTGACHNL